MNTTEKDKPVERAEIASMLDVEMVIWQAEAFMTMTTGELVRLYEEHLADGRAAAGVVQLCQLHRSRLNKAFNVAHKLLCEARAAAGTGGVAV